MKVRKQVPIRDVVVTSDDVRDLVARLTAEWAKIEDLGGYQSMHITVVAQDGTQYDLTPDELSGDDTPLERRRIEAIELAYTAASDHRINVTLRRQLTRRVDYSKAHVTGPDEAWVSGILGVLQSCVSNWRHRATWLDRHPSLSVGLLALVFTAMNLYFIYFSVDLAASLALLWLGYEPGPESLRFARAVAPFLPFIQLGSAFVLWLSHLHWADLLLSWVAGAYPSVELAMGPQHQRLESKRRYRLGWALSVVLIPLALALLIELAKWVLTR